MTPPAAPAAFERLEDRALLTYFPSGPEVLVNTYTDGHQGRPDVATDADGNFVVVWQGWDQLGSGKEVYGQRFAADGSRRGGEFRVNTNTMSDQGIPSVAMADDGRFVVVWESFGQDGDGLGIYAQRFDAAGTPVGAEFRVNVYTESFVTAWDGDQREPDVATDAAGNFVVTWASYQDSDGAAVMARRFDAAGVARGGEFRVNTTQFGHQSSPAVAMAGGGAFVVVWHSEDQDGSQWGIYGQRYTASGAAVGAEFRVNDRTAGNQWHSDVAMNDAGGFVVVWEGTGVSARRFDPSGMALGLGFSVPDSAAMVTARPSVAMRPDGSFLVVWAGADITAKEYVGGGATPASEFRVNSETAYTQMYPVVAVNRNGGGAFAWDTNHTFVSVDVAAQAFRVGATLPLPALTLTVSPGNVGEAGGAAAAVGTVTRDGDLSQFLTVRLSSSDTTEATVPATVTIAAGQASATFAIGAVNDAVFDGTQAVTITATAGDPAGGPLTPDASFGSAGVATTSLRMNIQPPTAAVAVQPDGKTVAAGEDPHTGSWRLTRLNADGSLDTSFGTNGAVTTQFSSSAIYPVPYRVVIQSDGKILVGGKISSGTGTAALARYNADGTLDTNFGNAGITDLTAANGWIEDIVVRSDGKILLAVAFNGTVCFRAVRLNANGQLDTSFSSTGVRTYTTISAQSQAVSVLSDGGFLLAGGNKVARFDAAGNLVTSFGVSGVRTVNFGTSSDVVDMAVLADGRIAVGFYLWSGTGVTSDFGAARLNANGSLDTTFSGDGWVRTDFFGGSDVPASMAVQADGKIILGGYMVTATGANDVALVRYGTNGELDPTFDGDGKYNTTLVPHTAERIFDIALQGTRLVALGGWGADYRVARYDLPGIVSTAQATLTVADDEPAPVSVLVDTLVDEDDGNYAAGDLSLREAAKIVAAGGTVTFAAALSGGTIALTQGRIALTQDMTITGLGANRLTVSGGGLSQIFYVTSAATVSMTGLTLTGGKSTLAGGAIENLGTLSLSGVAVTSSTADLHGGGISSGGSLVLMDVTVSGNTSRDGGGVYSTGTLTAANVTFSGNAGTYGGGLQVNGGTAVLRNVTAFANRAARFWTGTNGSVPGNGGGLYRAAGTMTIHNCLVAGNWLGDVNRLENDVAGAVAAGSRNNVIGEPFVTTGLTDGVEGNVIGVSADGLVDPVLRDNGGPTKTHALLPRSAAIDAGRDADAVDAQGRPLAFDQRGAGFARVIGTAVDAGAVEAQVIPPRTVVVDTLADEDDGNHSAGDLSLREAVKIVASGGTVSFASALSGGTITLSGTRIDLTSDVTIVGPGAGSLTINGGGRSQIFFIDQSTVSLSGLRLSGGNAAAGATTDSGGAIYNLNGTLTVADAALTGHSAQHSGGALFSNGGAVTVVRSTVSGNTSTFGGGINTDRGLAVVDSTISGNTASSGGGMYVSGGVTVVNSTFSGNTASVGVGGGMALGGGTTTLRNVTVTGNRGRGGGIHFNDDTYSKVVLYNSLVAGNFTAGTGGTPQDIFIAATGDTVDVASSNNLIGTAAFAGGLTNGANGNIVGVDPATLIDPVLRNNGGSTMTHAPVRGGRAVNAGSDAQAVDPQGRPLATDQRGAGFPRRSGRTVDIGAFELTNAGPVVQDLAVTIDEDVFYRGQLTATDVDGDTLTFAIAAGPRNGRAVVRADGLFTYLPNQHYFGTDSFTYTVTDGTATVTGTVTITINPVNDPAYAGNMPFTTLEDTALNDRLLHLEVEGEPVTFAVETGPSHGRLTLNADGSFQYTPDRDFSGRYVYDEFWKYYGSDSFTYRVTDDKGAYTVGIVVIDVTPVDDAPVATGDAFTVGEDRTLTISAAPVSRLVMRSEPTDWLGRGLSYDYSAGMTFDGRKNFDNGVRVWVTGGGDSWDLNFAAPFDALLTPGEYLNATRWPFQDPGRPGLDVSGNGSGWNTLAGEFFVYDVVWNADRTDVVSFAAKFEQRGVNSAGEPAPAALLGTIQYNTTLGTKAGVLADDVDADGDFLTAVLVDRPRYGELTLGRDGTLSYTPHWNFHGVDTFTYRVTDGVLTSDVVTVTITVTPENDRPVFSADPYVFTTWENTPAGTVVAVVSATDPEGSDIRYSIAGGNESGAFAIDAVTGRITVTDASKLDYEAVARFTLTVRATDGSAEALATDTTVVIDLTALPEVTAVRYGYGNDKWVTTAALGGRIAPWEVARVRATFDQEVSVDANDLTVSRLSGPRGTLATTGFSYDAATRTATWTLAAPIREDRIRVTIDGDGAADGNDGVRGGGGYLVGGDFLDARLDVLFGDVNGTGTVTVADAVLARNAINTTDAYADVNGTGTVTVADAVLVRNRINAALPPLAGPTASEPQVALAYAPSAGGEATVTRSASSIASFPPVPPVAPPSPVAFLPPKSKPPASAGPDGRDRALEFVFAAIGAAKEEGLAEALLTGGLPKTLLGRA